MKNGERDGSNPPSPPPAAIDSTGTGFSPMMSHPCVRAEEAAVVEATFDMFFHIQIDLRHLLEEEELVRDVVSEYYRITGDIESSLRKKKAPTSGRPTPSRSDQITRNSPTRYSIGFAIAKRGKLLRILTCAHSMDEVYHEGKHSMTCQRLNSFYRFQVHCIHQEDQLLKDAGDKSLYEIERYVADAYVVGLDTEKDMIVLELSTDRLFNGTDTDGNPIPCGYQHPVLEMAKSTSNVLDKVFLQGWPPQCYKTLACGQMCFKDRPYSAISSLNLKGYTMRLSEIPGLNGPQGSSGGPVITCQKQCLGVFHGVIDGRGFAVSKQDVEAFLKEHKMLDDWSNSVADLDNDTEEELEADDKKKVEVEDVDTEDDEEEGWEDEGYGMEEG